MTRPIDSHLVHTVDIVHVTMARGDRSVTITSGVSACVASVSDVHRDASGIHYETNTLIFLKPDEVITEKDEIIVDGKYRPVAGIEYCRDSTGIHHIEVKLA